MMDETQQQQVIIGSNKGKRTKRQRLAVTSSSSRGGERERVDNNMSSLSFPSMSIGFSGGEEEDMANCLILLAQGSQQKHQTRKLLHPAVMAPATTANKASYDYQCKTCNRCFPSFQSLGGHRASHKKPSHNKNNKVGGNEEKKVIEQEEDHEVLDNMSTTLSLHMPNRGLYDRIISSNNNIMKSNKVHECSVCGAEFSSGQALGGHMRRHRAAFANTSITPTTTTRSTSSHDDESPQEFKKQRNNGLELDLNLPAPEDAVGEPRFQFASKDQVLVFSASPLVDCHY